MAGQSAAPHSPEAKHRHWDKVVSAAYLRMMGQTQAEAAASVGRSERTIWGWENDAELWAAARSEARDRWLVEVTDSARRSVLKAAGRNADMGLKILERVDPALAPKQKHEHSGPEGKPIQVAGDLAGLPLAELLALRQKLLAGGDPEADA